MGIFRGLGKLDHVSLKILNQVVVEAVLLQELEGIIPRADVLELKAEQVFAVIVQKRIENLSVIEELLEDPKSLPSLKNVMCLRRSITSNVLTGILGSTINNTSCSLILSPGLMHNEPRFHV